MDKLIKVAIADDSEIIRERLAEKLSVIGGIKVCWQTGNINDTVESMTSNQPEYLILDIQMPGGSGIDILQMIRNQNRNIRVIMLTNYGSEPFRKKCMCAGADYFFDKTQDFEKVIDVLKNAAHSSSIKNS